MFWVLTGLRKIRVSTLNARVLIAMTQLLGEAVVTVVAMLFVVPRALGAVGIVVRNLRHGETPDRENYWPGRVLADTPSLRSRSRACSASLDLG